MFLRSKAVRLTGWDSNPRPPSFAGWALCHLSYPDKLVGIGK
jgi:hypothetical protein